MVNKFISIDSRMNGATRILLGLIVALTLLFSALEFRSGGGDDDWTDTDDDDMLQDMELHPMQDRKDMISVVQPGKTQHAVTKKIKKVDQPAESEMQTNLDQQDGDDDKGSGGNSGTDAGEDKDNETTALPQTPADLNNNPLNLRIVEQLPEFPGGMVEMMKWITKNLKYPQAAQRRKIQGKVVVAFIIGKDGSISETKVVNGVDPLLDNEALRVIKMMPKWKPGKDKGKPCMTYFSIPVVFKL